jgi:hypothetical protein
MSTTKEILLRFDEAGAYETPSGFDYAELEQRAKLVLADLESTGSRVSFEGANFNQDASFSVQILLHDYEKSRDRMLYQPTVRFSNFGNLATVTWCEQIPEEMLRLILGSLAQRGFTYIPVEDLDAEYDGVMPEKDVFHTWWTRYFDWL